MLSDSRQVYSKAVKVELLSAIRHSCLTVLIRRLWCVEARRRVRQTTFRAPFLSYYFPQCIRDCIILETQSVGKNCTLKIMEVKGKKAKARIGIVIGTGHFGSA